MKRISKWIGRLLGAVAIAAVVIAFCVPQSAVAQGGYPLGADIVTSATDTNLHCVLTNTAGSGSAVITSQLVYNVENPKRVRCTISGDTATAGYVGYAIPVWTNSTGTLGTNYLYLAGTNGFPLRAGAAFSTTNTCTSQRPALWKSYFVITFAPTIACSNSVTVDVPIRDEAGSY